MTNNMINLLKMMLRSMQDFLLSNRGHLERYSKRGKVEKERIIMILNMVGQEE